MNFKTLDDRFAVGEQVSPSDLDGIAAAGFRSIICSRPDGEGWGQPDFAEIERTAKALGLEAAYLPIVPGQMGEAEARRFGDLMRTLPGPVFGYCKSGARAAGLWQAARTMNLVG